MTVFSLRSWFVERKSRDVSIYWTNYYSVSQEHYKNVIIGSCYSSKERIKMEVIILIARAGDGIQRTHSYFVSALYVNLIEYFYHFQGIRVNFNMPLLRSL